MESRTQVIYATRYWLLSEDKRSEGFAPDSKLSSRTHVGVSLAKCYPAPITALVRAFAHSKVDMAPSSSLAYNSIRSCYWVTFVSH